MFLRFQQAFSNHRFLDPLHKVNQLLVTLNCALATWSLRKQHSQGPSDIVNRILLFLVIVNDLQTICWRSANNPKTRKEECGCRLKVIRTYQNSKLLNAANRRHLHIHGDPSPTLIFLDLNLILIILSQIRCKKNLRRLLDSLLIQLIHIDSGVKYILAVLISTFSKPPSRTCDLWIWVWYAHISNTACGCRYLTLFKILQTWRHFCRQSPDFTWHETPELTQAHLTSL